jgi:hypothetical protein
VGRPTTPWRGFATRCGTGRPPLNFSAQRAQPHLATGLLLPSVGMYLAVGGIVRRIDWGSIVVGLSA